MKFSIQEEGGEKQIFFTFKEANEKTGIPSSNIWRVLKRENKKFKRKDGKVFFIQEEEANEPFLRIKKKVNLNLKEKARKKLLELNAKIKEMFEKPEFEWEEKPGLGGSTFVVRGKEGYSAEGFLKSINEKTVEILQKHFGFKVKMVLVCRMISHNLAKETSIENDAFFSSPVEEVFEGTDLIELVKKMNEWMLESMRNYQKGRSNWKFLKVEKLEIHLDEMTVGKFILSCGEKSAKNNFFVKKTMRGV